MEDLTEGDDGLIPGQAAKRSHSRKISQQQGARTVNSHLPPVTHTPALRQTARAPALRDSGAPLTT